MLALPEVGFSRSTESHNVDDDRFCDWIEASAVFGNGEVSKSDVSDILIENSVYEQQDFASEKIDEAWGIIRRRIEQIKRPLGIKVEADRIRCPGTWDNCPPYSFCLLLSCAALYPNIWGADQGGYTKQGDIFEAMAHDSIAEQMPKWMVQRVGWPTGNGPCTTVNNVINWTNEKQGSDFQLHVTSHVKDFGLDLLVYLPFNDNLPNLPVLMAQCASGKNWYEKRKQPDIAVWEKVISFNTKPIKMFITPFAFAHPNDFRRKAASIEGICIERYRLLAPLRNGNDWLSRKLAKSIVIWSKKKIEELPKANK